MHRSPVTTTVGSVVSEIGHVYGVGYVRSMNVTDTSDAKNVCTSGAERSSRVAKIVSILLRMAVFIEEPASCSPRWMSMRMSSALLHQSAGHPTWMFQELRCRSRNVSRSNEVSGISEMPNWMVVPES